jgi:hypothetical protein
MVLWMRWLSSSIMRSCRLMVLLADSSYLAMSKIFECFCFLSSCTNSVRLAVTSLLLSTLPDFSSPFDRSSSWMSSTSDRSLASRDTMRRVKPVAVWERVVVRMVSLSSRLSLAF